jgi:3-oxoacyl-[acyl-carrier-protein] synthase I
MTLLPVVILGAGVVTAIGDDVVSTCAAMRARFNNHKETDFTDQDWNPVVASRAAIDPSLIGEGRLIEMAAAAIKQLASPLNVEQLSNIPWLLCTPEESRIGRPANDNVLLTRIAERLGVKLHSASAEVAHGRAAGLMAMAAAQTMLNEGKYEQVLLVATDSLIDADGLADLEEKGLLLTPENSSGLIPGEAAVALLLAALDTKAQPTAPSARRLRMVFDSAAFTITDPEAIPPQSRPEAINRKPIPIDGMELATAIELACELAHCMPEEITVRMADCNGTEAGFKESALAEARAFQSSEQPLPPLWLPAECVGEVGCAFVPLCMAWAWHAAIKGYLPGQDQARPLIHTTNADGLRGAAVFRFEEL